MPKGFPSNPYWARRKYNSTPCRKCVITLSSCLVVSALAMGGMVGRMLFNACGVVDVLILKPFNFDFFLLYDGENRVAALGGVAAD